MGTTSRSLNSARNILVSLTCQVAYIAITFINRTIFVKMLGAEYTGINGLFQNILSIFSLAELGIGNVMIYSLYEPIHENDHNKISQLLNYLRKIYIIISIVILILGIALLPFLRSIVNSALPMANIYIYYILFLVNSVCSYIYAHKITLINADQKVHIVRSRTFLFQLAQNILQIILLLQTQNFLLYLIIQLVSTIATNTVLGFKADRLYPFVRSEQTLPKANRHLILSKIKSTAIYKISVVIMNHTDNILISVIVGTVFVGYYSNYTLIVSVINTLVSLIVSAIIPSIGNLNASSSPQKKCQIFNTLVLSFHWLVAICSIAFYFLLNNFIAQWIGPSYVLGKDIVVAITINFFVSNIINPVWMYREAAGLFEDVRYIMLVASIVNIILSVIFGNLFGMSGILIATAVARCATTVWYEPRILHKKVFHTSARHYFLHQLKYLLATMVSFLSVGGIIHLLELNSIDNIIVTLCICALIPNLIFFIVTFRTPEFRHIVSIIKTMLSGMIRKCKE